jgi:hypothetical protein
MEQIGENSRGKPRESRREDDVIAFADLCDASQATASNLITHPQFQQDVARILL